MTPGSFVESLYLQNVRGLSPLVAGTVFLAPLLRRRTAAAAME